MESLQSPSACEQLTRRPSRPPASLHLSHLGRDGVVRCFYHLCNLNASTPPSVMHTKQKPTAHNGPGPLSRKPKSQLQQTVLIPAAKRRMPATAPGERPARSLPMARQVAKMGERPMLVRAIASVAMS